MIHVSSLLLEVLSFYERIEYRRQARRDTLYTLTLFKGHSTFKRDDELFVKYFHFFFLYTE